MTPSGMPVQNPPCGLSNRGGPGLTQRVQRTLAATTGTPVSMMSAAQNNLLGAEAVHSNLHSTQATVECNVERMRAVQGQCIAQQYRPWPVAAHGQSKWMHDKAPSMPRATRSGQTHVQTSGMASTPQTGWCAQHRTEETIDSATKTHTNEEDDRSSGRKPKAMRPAWMDGLRRQHSPCSDDSSGANLQEVTLNPKERCKRRRDGGKNAMNADARHSRDERNLHYMVR